LEEVCLELLALKTEWEYAVDGAKKAAEKQKEARTFIAKFRPDPSDRADGPRLVRPRHISPVELDDVIGSIERVVSCFFEEQRRHYKEHLSDDHVFVHLVRLRNMLENTADKPEDLAKTA